MCVQGGFKLLACSSWALGGLPALYKKGFSVLMLDL